MIAGTLEQWATHLALQCTCGHPVREHVNGRGPCEHRDGCTRLDPAEVSA